MRMHVYAYMYTPLVVKLLIFSLLTAIDTPGAQTASEQPPTGLDTQRPQKDQHTDTIARNTDGSPDVRDAHISQTHKEARTHEGR